VKWSQVPGVSIPTSTWAGLQWPQDVARAWGHAAVAEYLDDVCARFEKCKNAIRMRQQARGHGGAAARGEPSRGHGVDAAGVSPVPAQMWQQARGLGAPS
jgi:hypothetical protein